MQVCSLKGDRSRTFERMSRSSNDKTGKDKASERPKAFGRISRSIVMGEGEIEASRRWRVETEGKTCKLDCPLTKGGRGRRGKDWWSMSVLRVYVVPVITQWITVAPLPGGQLFNSSAPNPVCVAANKDTIRHYARYDRSFLQTSNRSMS